MIFIQKVSEAKLRLNAPKDVLLNISEQLEFYVPGYKYTPKYRSGMWDGKIRLLNSYNGLAPAGLVFRIADMLEDMGLEYEIDPSYMTDPKIPENIAEIVAKKSGTTFVPHDYQIEAVYESIANKRRLIISPTGSGKSFTTFLLNKYFEFSKIATLVIVPRKALAKQMSTDYIDYQGHADGIHTIIGGVEKDTDALTVITTWQSIQNQPPEWFQRFGAVIVDEAHEAKATSLSKILDMCVGVKYRIGLTGTTDDEIPNELTLEGHFGPKITVAETWELIDRGVLADLTIKVLHLNYDDDTRFAVSKIRNFADEKVFIKNHKNRNKLIAGLAASQAGNMLVLVEHRDQLDELVKITKKITNREIFIIHGGVKIKEREKIRKDIESKDNIILFATFGSFSVGSNVKKLDKCILATSFKSKIRVLQSIGRTLRKGNGSDSAVVYDPADDMTYDGKPNFTFVHAKGRIEHYIKGKLRWEMIPVNIKT